MAELEKEEQNRAWEREIQDKEEKKIRFFFSSQDINGTSVW